MTLPKKHRLHVVISLDVEEEGLFSGYYPSRNPSVTNVGLLRKLEPLTREFGFAPTLFCSHAVFKDPASLTTLAYMRDHCDAEIGAHLHRWSTPPFSNDADENSPPLRTHLLPKNILEGRLESLLAAGLEFMGAPLRSFRMGRWDLKSSILPMLARHGIEVDSSICPLRAFAGGADHFLAPADPWWADTGEGRKILEAPITQIPISCALARGWHNIFAGNTNILDKFHFFGALSANPFWHGPAAMRMAATLHAARGGKVLSLFWHSSEMMPKGSPHTPDQAAADKMLAKIFSFCAWLKDNFDAKGVTASGLCGIPEAKNFACAGIVSGRDW